MDPDYEKSLTTPSPNGPQFRPARGLMITGGSFVIFCGLVLCGLGWFYAKKMPGMIGSAGTADAPLSGAMNGVFASFGIMLALIGLGWAVLGAGSIALRKWARDLLVACGWLLIALAVFMVLSILIMLPSMMAMSQEIAGAASGSGVPGMSWFMMIGMIVAALFYLLLIGGPGALLLVIYRRKNVELTARYYHQAPTWTDKCHTTVLVLWLFYILALIGVAAMTFGYIPLALELKLISSAQTGYLFLAGALVLLAILAFGVSRAAPWAWWASLIYAFASIGLGYYMLNNFDWAAINQQMMSTTVDNEELAAMMKRQQEMSMKAGYISGGLTWVIWVAYLFLIRKHFGSGKSRSAQLA